MALDHYSAAASATAACWNAHTNLCCYLLAGGEFEGAERMGKMALAYGWTHQIESLERSADTDLIAIQHLAAMAARRGRPHFAAHLLGFIDVMFVRGVRRKMPKVHRVTAAIDCGTVVNPDIVVQQAQGATNFGLSAALTGKITIANGRCQQSNFYDYTVLHMAEAPAIEVHVVSSTAPPTGVGEICTPPIAPAVGNAVFALIGKRVRSLPFGDFFA